MQGNCEIFIANVHRIKIAKLSFFFLLIPFVVTLCPFDIRNYLYVLYIFAHSYSSFRIVSFYNAMYGIVYS